MPRIFVNAALLVLLLLVLVLAAAMRRDFSEPNFTFMREMVDSIPYNAYASNPVLPGGRTLQPPIPGTIARGESPFHYAATPEDALRAGAELTNPYAEAMFWNETDESLLAKVDEGAETYRIYCMPCHGPTGNGDGLVAMRGYPPPPPLTAEKTVNMPDGQLFHVLTLGQGNMPGYASQVSKDDRWKTILYIRSLQEAAASAAGGTQE